MRVGRSVKIVARRVLAGGRSSRYHVIRDGDNVIERHKVVLFLHLMKVAANEQFVFVPRRINIEGLARLGINRRHAQELVTGLTPQDYVNGPVPDHNNPGLEMWVFGLRVRGSEVYMKIQVIADPPERCVCISFHESERPMHYPFRETTSATEEER